MTTKSWHGPVAWRNWGNMTPSPPAPTPYTQGAGWYTDAELKPVAELSAIDRLIRDWKEAEEAELRDA